MPGTDLLCQKLYTAESAYAAYYCKVFQNARNIAESDKGLGTLKQPNQRPNIHQKLPPQIIYGKRPKNERNRSFATTRAQAVFVHDYSIVHHR